MNKLDFTQASEVLLNYSSHKPTALMTHDHDDSTALDHPKKKRTVEEEEESSEYKGDDDSEMSDYEEK